MPPSGRVGHVGQDVTMTGTGDALGGDAALSEQEALDLIRQHHLANPTAPLPGGYRLDDDGQVVSDKTFMQRHSWLAPLLFGAGGGALGLATGAIGAGAGATTGAVGGLGASAGGAAPLGAAGAVGGGIGETGAVSGLAGSGLAGELGGIGATTVTAGGVGMPAVAGANGSILDSIGGIAGAAKKVSPILGAINQNRASNQQATDITRIAQKNYELGAPGKRLDTSRKASLIDNFQPVKAQWGGPGSGLRGEHVNFTGGFSNPGLYSPDTKALAQDIMHKQLLASLNGEDKLPDAGKSSVWDKILGGIGTGASILGAFA